MNTLLRHSVQYCALASLFLALQLIGIPATAQTKQTITLSAQSSAIACTEPTETGVRYTVTVTGTYSMWPQYDGEGVDAAYVYDVPVEEINALRWPPQRLLNQDVYPLPHWVGDTLEVPPFTIPGLQFKFRTIDNIGFRINGQPLAATPTGPDMQTHRYQTTIMGNGAPICFQILDSAFDIQQNRIIPRYDDNSGSLTIVVEREPYLTVCDADIICNDGVITGISVSAALLQYIDEYHGQPQNTLYTASQIALALDGRFICPDSIVCNARTSECIAAALVLDRSGSMEFEFPGSSSRMHALQQAAHTFLGTFGDCDKASLVTFSNDVALDVDWTENIAAVRQAVSSMQTGGNTALYDAALLGIQRAAVEYNPNKAVVLFTDGGDNQSTSSEHDVIALAQQEQVPVFVVSAALDDPIAVQSLIRIATQTGGKYFDAQTTQSLDSVFNTIAASLVSEECCTIYFGIPDSISNNPGRRLLQLLTFDRDNTVHGEQVEIDIPVDCSLISTVDDNADVASFVQGKARVIPNPALSTAHLHLELQIPARVAYCIRDLRGIVLVESAEQLYPPGTHILDLSTAALPTGMYFITLDINGTPQKGLPFLRR